MAAKKLEKFGGMLPAWEPHLIPDGQAANAANCYLFSGSLQGWRLPTLLRQLNNSAAKFAYRLPATTQAPAVAYLVLESQPLAGDTVTLGESTYTWASSITSTSAPYSVLIGATATVSATNMLTAFTADNGAYTNQGVLYGVGTAPNIYITTPGLIPQNNGLISTGLGPAIVVISPGYGAAFNSTPVSESTGGVRTIWLYDTASLTHTTATFTGGVNQTFNSTITGSSTWLEFLDPDTNVVKSQVVNDQYQRYYFASPSIAPTYNTTSRINAGQPAFTLGINAPGCAPVVAVGGGGDNVQIGTPGSIGGNSISVGANVIYLIPIVPTGALDCNDVSFVVDANTDDPNVSWQTVLYGDAGVGNSSPTTPGELLSISAILQGFVAGATQVGTFTNPTPLLPGTPYWIGLTLSSTDLVTNGDGGSGSSTFPNTFVDGPPAFAPPVTGGAANLQMWADCTTQDVLEARAYVYTWISAYGEESPPSPYTLVNGWSNGVWNVGLWSPAPEDLGTVRNLAVLRLYRTVTSTSGLTTYYQIADVSLGSADTDAIAYVQSDQGCLQPAATYIDVSSDAVIAQNIQLPSTNYFPPPENLQGFLNMPNGLIASFRNNEIWFNEPYYPHAWPPGYTLSTDFPIVGIGLTNGAVVACTSATPYVASGVTPGQFSLYKCSKPEPCTSRGSIVSLDGGVLYISPNGLIQVPNTGQLRNLTESWIKREDWQELVPQKNTRAIPLVGAYVCFGTTNGTGAGADVSVAQQGFTLELAADTQSFSIWPEPGGHRLGFMPLTSPLFAASAGLPDGSYDIDNIFIDPWTGIGEILMNGQIYYYDFTNQSPLLQPHYWLSKKYQEVNKKNYSAMRIFCQVPPNSPPTMNPQRNVAPSYDASWAPQSGTTVVSPLQANQLAIIKVWADVADAARDGAMQLVMARELTKSGQIMRIPDGFKAENWQVEVISRVIISNIQLATSVAELAKV